jgi:hypothetical protein
MDKKRKKQSKKVLFFAKIIENWLHLLESYTIMGEIVEGIGRVFTRLDRPCAVAACWTGGGASDVGSHWCSMERGEHGERRESVRRGG